MHPVEYKTTNRSLQHQQFLYDV